MANPIRGLLGRFAKWLFKKGKEELEKEIDERIGDRRTDDREPPPRQTRGPRGD